MITTPPYVQQGSGTTSADASIPVSHETGDRAREVLWALMLAFLDVDEDRRGSLVRFSREFRRLQTQYVNGDAITVGDR